MFHHSNAFWIFPKQWMENRNVTLVFSCLLTSLKTWPWVNHSIIISFQLAFRRCLMNLLSNNRAIRCFVTSSCTNTATSINELTKLLFARKGRSLEGIPPSADTLFQHTNLATYQGAHCWSQSLCRIQILPNPTELGWNLGELVYCQWMDNDSRSI